MRLAGLKKRVAQAAAVGMVAAGLAVTGGAAPAQAATCSSGYFCYWSGTSYSGTRVTIYNYQSSWATLPGLVDASKSSWNNQVYDSCGTPQVFFSDTYLNLRNTSDMGTPGRKISTFNPIKTSNKPAGENMNNLFNQFRNVCW